MSKNMLSISDNPVIIEGVNSYLPSRKLRESEDEDYSIPNIYMTSEVPFCEPSEISFEDQEDAITDFRGQVIINETITRGQRIINYFSTGGEYVVYFTNDENFFNALTIRSMWIG